MVLSEDKDLAIEGANGLLDETNWQEGFGWITIDIRCATCGDTHDSWAGYETM